MLRKVKLYGELADFVGHKELEAVINSTADAIRFLVSNFPKLKHIWQIDIIKCLLMIMILMKLNYIIQ